MRREAFMLWKLSKISLILCSFTTLMLLFLLVWILLQISSNPNLENSTYILINNAGIGGLVIKDNDLVPQVLFKSRELSDDGIEKAKIVQTFELAEECLQINYYGAKRTSEALLPFLQLSESPRIVNVSSFL
ncbi:hypothetical protein HN51_067731 [Arachis hypogaea]|nr:Short-chain dehydrogenase/reductase 2b [Arachis hypogaea]